MKKYITLFFFLLCSAYLVMAVTIWNKPNPNAVCKDVALTIEDSAKAGFIHADEIERILKRKGMYPRGKYMAYVNTAELEKKLKEMALIEDVVCYKTVRGTVCIQITQRLPVMRIISSKGEDYYLDAKGRIMPETKNPADLVIATGDISRDFARKYLTRIGSYLQATPFWNSQIEQINVTPEHTLELVPRVGNNIIYLGDPVNTMDKLKRLNVFYEKVISVVGWDKYSKINLEYPNQIICTKKEK